MVNHCGLIKQPNNLETEDDNASTDYQSSL